MFLSSFFGNLMKKKVQQRSGNNKSKRKNLGIKQKYHQIKKSLFVQSLLGTKKKSATKNFKSSFVF